MPLTPLPGVQPRALLDALRRTQNSAAMAQGAGTATMDRLIAYLRWARDAASQLNRMIRAEDVDRLVLTRRHWVLQTVDPGGIAEAIAPLVNIELDERERAFADAVAEQEAVVGRWADRGGFVVVADTNVYVEHEVPFESYDWRGILGARMEGVHLAVPMIVVDELDGLKRSHRKSVKLQAREKLRRLEELLVANPLGAAQLRPASADAGPVTIELLVDDPGHVRLPDADDELVDRALALSCRAGREVHFVTGDHGALFRGAVAGLVVHHLSAPADT